MTPTNKPQRPLTAADIERATSAAVYRNCVRSTLRPKPRSILPELDAFVNARKDAKAQR